MPDSTNVVVLSGNLTRPPELRTTPGGTSVCSLRIAVNGREKQGEEWVDSPNYFSVTVWGRQAENCAEYLEKGRPVNVEGRLRWREYDDRDGNRREVVEVVARSVQFLAGGDRDRPRAEPDVPAPPVEAPTPTPTGLDDVPF